MTDIVIYHNNRCSKSRAGLKHLEDKGIEPRIVKYLDEGIQTDELAELLRKLGMRPMDIMRTKEELFRTEYKGKELSDDEWIRILCENPKLIERPIVVRGNKAVLARPAEKIDELL